MRTTGKRAGVIALVVGGLAVVLLPLLGGSTRLGTEGFGGMDGYGGMMGGYGSYGTGGTLIGIASQVGILLLLLGGGYLLYRALVTDSGRSLGITADPAIDELRHAYARGTISDEEFERRRAVLEQHGDNR